MNGNMSGKGKGKGGIVQSVAKPVGKMKPGDWRCPGCGDHQFAKNDTCRQCGTEKQQATTICGMKPGDWRCPKCKDLQFAKNDNCRQCGFKNPNPEASKAAMEAGIASGNGGQVEKP